MVAQKVPVQSYALAFVTQLTVSPLVSVAIHRFCASIKAELSTSNLQEGKRWVTLTCQKVQLHQTERLNPLE